MKKFVKDFAIIITETFLGNIIIAQNQNINTNNSYDEIARH